MSGGWRVAGGGSSLDSIIVDFYRQSFHLLFGKMKLK